MSIILNGVLLYHIIWTTIDMQRNKNGTQINDNKKALRESRICYVAIKLEMT
jgi:hypothetical protein